MVTKEQRRGARKDLYDLREFVHNQVEYQATKGQVALKFDWARSKLISMFNQCAQAFDDIELIRGSLFFIGPYPAKEEKE